MKGIRIYNWIAALCIGLMLSACGGGQQEEQLFSATLLNNAEQALAKKVEYLGIEKFDFGDDLTAKEKAAMTWIYAYSYTPDILDQTTDFHLANVRKALQAREELPWGKSVPADQWRAFVLPLRVNNEVLDDFRTEYYEELRDLVKDMTMEEAVLELNHWSHQHITYEPSDGRTSSPIATLRNALGRCGEQSTFVAAVLRTVGIPARQVYTPRWAHTDNNHAWVEAWVDGEWRYLGASEPAPVLDNAWFDAPVLRAMLLHSRAFGPYQGMEEWLGEDLSMTELNVSENYVPTAPAKVVVVDKEGRPQEGVEVTFRLYNYVELYPIVTRKTNRLGEASVKLGLGDIMIVAGRSPQEMAIGQLSNVEGGGTITLTLDSFDNMPEDLHFRITPPVERVPELDITEEMEARNIERMAENNKIRGDYTATFPTDIQATELADQLKLTGNARSELIRLFPISRGYHKEIQDFLLEAKEAGKANEAVFLLSTLRDKDLHDINISALREVLSRELSPKEWQNSNLVCPRVMLEHIYPAQASLDAAFDEIRASLDWDNMSVQEQAEALAIVVQDFKVDELYNPRQMVLNPATVWKYRMGDRKSLDVFMVRLLRTAKIPAEYDAANSVIVFYDEKSAPQILPFFQPNEEPVSADCLLKLSYKPEGYLKTPKYESNFTIGYVTENGQIASYGFEYDLPYDKVSGTKLVNQLNYLATGSRLADGTAMMALRKLNCGEVTPIVYDRDEAAISVIGGFDAESLYYDLKSETEKSVISTTGRGYYVLVLGRPHHEPTDHILRDMQVLLDDSGQLPIPVIVLTDKNGKPTSELQALLPQATWGQDTQGIEQKIIEGNELGNRVDKPLVIIADTFNRVVFISQGYTIGIGERIAQVIAEI